MKQVMIKLYESNVGEDRFSRRRRLEKSVLSILHIYYVLLLLIFALSLQCGAIVTAIATEFNLVTRHFICNVSCQSATDVNVNATAKMPAGLFGGLDVKR